MEAFADLAKRLDALVIESGPGGPNGSLTVDTFNRSVRKLESARIWSGLGMGMTTGFEAVLAALLARDNAYPSDPEQKNMVKAEFLRGAATAFALCLRGEESSQCLEAAKGLYDQLKSPDRAPAAGIIHDDIHSMASTSNSGTPGASA